MKERKHRQTQARSMTRNFEDKRREIHEKNQFRCSILNLHGWCYFFLFVTNTRIDIRLRESASRPGWKTFSHFSYEKKVKDKQDLWKILVEQESFFLFLVWLNDVSCLLKTLSLHSDGWREVVEREDWADKSAIVVIKTFYESVTLRLGGNYSEVCWTF